MARIDRGLSERWLNADFSSSANVSALAPPLEGLPLHSVGFVGLDEPSQQTQLLASAPFPPTSFRATACPSELILSAFSDISRLRLEGADDCGINLDQKSDGTLIARAIAYPGSRFRGFLHLAH